MKRITLKEYIEFVGQKKAAVIFDCSEAACKAWRYGHRQPRINQAKKIIIWYFDNVFNELDNSLLIRILPTK